MWRRFIIGWRYITLTPCAYQFYIFFFHFTTFWIELKNTNKIFKQLHHCFKSAKKDEITWWLNDKKKLATYIFLLHQFGLPLPYVNFLNSTSCSAIAVGIIGLLKQLSFHVPPMHLLVCSEYPKSLLV